MSTYDICSKLHQGCFDALQDDLPRKPWLGLSHTLLHRSETRSFWNFTPGPVWLGKKVPRNLCMHDASTHFPCNGLEYYSTLFGPLLFYCTKDR
jgi:hypothetical protein